MHFPTGSEWAHRDPETLGVDPDRLDEAVEYHLLCGTPHEQVNYDFADSAWREEEGEHGERIGPMPERRGGPAGLVLKDGYLLAEWGDTRRVDHAFSVAKSFLSIVGGIAWDRGLFDLDDRVAETVDDGGFEGDHNGQITWRQLFHQTSEWEGTLFGKPDEVDRNRPVGKDVPLDKTETRELREPGTVWEYNDVRINRLALSLLRVLGRPLPRVLAENVMTPVGATDSWEWHGYYNSVVDVDGTAMRSVSGGGHWGGGLWISTRDLARVGLLAANGGAWDGRQVLSAEWLETATAPCDVNESYGTLWWLNTDRTLWPSAPASSFAGLGHGQNVLWVDPDRDLVAVLRWLHIPEDRRETDANPAQDGFLERLLEAV